MSSGKLTAVITGFNPASVAVARTLLKFVVGILRWIIGRYQELVRWATGRLLVWRIGTQCAGAAAVFLQPVLNFLRRVAAVIANVVRLPYELGTRISNAIPVCLREPYIRSGVPLILRQITFFRDLAATPEVWHADARPGHRGGPVIFRDST